MRFCLLTFIFTAVFILSISNEVNGSPYFESDYGVPGSDMDEMMQQPFSEMEKRACVRRGGNCDHRPNECCYNSSCRCNLWGSNCRCQRMGLFQKWG